MKKMFKSILSCISVITMITAIMPVPTFAHKPAMWGKYYNGSLLDGTEEYTFRDNGELVNIQGYRFTKELIIDDLNESIVAKQRALKAVVENKKDYYINCYKNVCYVPRCANNNDINPDRGYCPNSHGFPAEGLARSKGTFYQNYVYEYWRLENEIYKVVNGTDVPQIVDFFKAEDINMNVPIPLRELPCNYTGYVRGDYIKDYKGEVIGEPYTGDDGITHGFTEQIAATPAPTPTPTPVPTTPPQAVEKINEIKSKTDVENTLLVIDTDGVLTVAVNGEIVKFPDLQPFVNAAYTQIPVRAVAETFNCDVDWDGKTSTVIINGNGKLITLTIGSYNMTINGVDTPLETRAMLKDERACVPLRAIAEALGLTVKYEKI